MAATKRRRAGGSKRGLRGDPIRDLFKAVLDRLDELGRRWERSTATIEKTHAEEFRLTRLVLRDHNRRLQALEKKR